MAPRKPAACLSALASLIIFAVFSHCLYSCIYTHRVNSYCLVRDIYCESNLSSTCSQIAWDLPSSHCVSDIGPIRRVKYGKSRTSYYNNADSTFNIALTAILLSNDVHVHPGPTSTDCSTRDRHPSPCEHNDHVIDHCHQCHHLITYTVDQLLRLRSSTDTMDNTVKRRLTCLGIYLNMSLRVRGRRSGLRVRLRRMACGDGGH